ncbi:winged helix-turn-helix transcriptional regulator [Clostridium polynesiense]|uniref:winged helix-turn-helix transcriptional regulator n=1 Tax=Clostridium polynesiense TaxID=1325933 RepID=UPI0005910DF4|nr:response regulator transcription factor [Clostridium polynesiense]
MDTIKRILVVDEEKRNVNIIENYLQREGYIIYKSYAVNEALEILNIIDIALIIISDKLLVKFEKSLQQLSDEKQLTTIMVLKDSSSLKMKKAELNSKREYFNVKPFNARLFMAKVNTVIKNIDRKKSTSLRVYSYNDDDLSIDFDVRVVKKKGAEISLTSTEYRILTLMASNPNKVFTRSELLDYVMRQDFDGFDRVIDSHIKNLRSKIEDNSRNPKYIVTIHKVGYKFVGI